MKAGVRSREYTVWLSAVERDHWEESSCLENTPYLVERMAVKQCVVIVSVGPGKHCPCRRLFNSPGAPQIQMGKLSFKELITCVGLPTDVEWRQT